tara:strand:+ start:545 stop:1681 length:1137 start_codon:yes stop_codon:yes gene_type:complete
MIKFVKLGDACLVRRGTTITRKQTKKGNVPVIAGGKKATYFHNQHNRKPGTITISGSGASAGLVNYWQIPIFASDCSTVELKDNKQSIKFVYYYMQSMQELIYKEMRSGAAQPHVYAKDIANLNFPLLSLEEQQRIVAKLDVALYEIDKEINAAKYKQTIVDSLKKNILAKKFELDSDVIKLGDLCEVITKGTTPTSLGYKFIDKGINFIKIESITNNGNFIKNKFAYINKDCNAALMRSQLQAGDILFSIAGALGRTAIVTEEILPANTNQALAILRIKKDIKVDKKFLLHCLNSDAVKKQSDTFKGGVAQQNLSLSQLKSYNIPLPSLLEQKDIVTKLDLIFTEIHKLKNFIETKIKNYQTLNYAILTKELQKEAA